MTISDKTFDSMAEDENVELLDFFIKNKGKAFSLPYLENKFGNHITHDLITLIMHDKIIAKNNKSESSEGILYFRLKIKSSR